MKVDLLELVGDNKITLDNNRTMYLFENRIASIGVYLFIIGSLPILISVILFPIAFYKVFSKKSKRLLKISITLFVIGLVSIFISFAILSIYFTRFRFVDY